jgi:hypothetical protein
LSLRSKGAAAAAGGSGRAAKKLGSRLMLVDLASGEMNAPNRFVGSPYGAVSPMLSAVSPYAGSPARPQSAAARSLAVLGACVATAAEGVVRAVPWRESTLALLLREPLSADFCTAVLGGCGAAESDVHGTISTLHFLMHCGRLSTHVRTVQPPLEALVRRLRTLNDRRSLEHQRWIEQPPRAITVVSAVPTYASHGHDQLGATGGAEDTWPQQEAEHFQALSSQLGLLVHERTEQARVLRANMRETQGAIAEAGGKRVGRPWGADGPAGLTGAFEVVQKLEVAEQLVRAVEEWMVQVDDSYSALRHRLNLSGTK